MCQLLGMNCNTPTDIVFSFEGFRRRAGLTDCHSDGFGIAFFEGRGVRIFRDNHAASQSPIADCVKQYNIKSLNVPTFARQHKAVSPLKIPIPLFVKFGDKIGCLLTTVI